MCFAAKDKQSTSKERMNGMKCEFNFTVGGTLNDKGVCGCVAEILQIRGFLNVIVVSSEITSMFACPTGYNFILTKSVLSRSNIFPVRLIKCQSLCWIT